MIDRQSHISYIITVLITVQTCLMHGLALTTGSRSQQAMHAGGTQQLLRGNPYYDAMSTLTDMAMHEYDQSGEIFPIHFTCLGWEAIAVKVTNDPFILSAFLTPELLNYAHG
jgi:hypothetical protein